MSRNRKAWRKKQKFKKSEERMLYEPSIKNEYGNTDLTPFNAEMLIKGKMTIDEIKY